MNPTVLISILLNFLHFASIYASRPYMALLAVDNGAGGVMIGLIASGYALVQVVSALPTGRAIDRYGQKGPLILGSTLFGVASLMMMFTGSVWVIFASSLLMGISHNIIILASQSIMTSVKDKDARNTGVGWFYFANSLGVLVGPYAGGFLQDTLGPNTGFVGAVGLSVISVALSLAVKNKKPASRENLKAAGILKLLCDRQIASNLLLCACVNFSIDIMSVYLPLHGKAVGLTTASCGLLLSANGLAQIVIRPLIGSICKKLTIIRAFVACLIIGGIGFAAIGLAKDFWTLLAIILVTGLAIGLANPLTLITVSDIARPDNRSSVLALRTMANYAAQSASQVVYGAIIQATAVIAPVFFCSGGFMLLSVFAAARILKKTPDRKELSQQSPVPGRPV